MSLIAWHFYNESLTRSRTIRADLHPFYVDGSSGIEDCSRDNFTSIDSRLWDYHEVLYFLLARIEIYPEDQKLRGYFLS